MSEFAIVDGVRYEAQDGVLAPSNPVCPVCKACAPLCGHTIAMPRGSEEICGECYAAGRRGAIIWEGDGWVRTDLRAREAQK